MKKFLSAPSDSATLTNYMLINLFLSGICASMMRGTVAVESDSFDKTIELIVLFVIISLAGQLVCGVISDFFTNRHLLVQVSVMTVCAGFLMPSSFGLTLKTVLCAIGYALFMTSAGASIKFRSKGRMIGYGIFSSLAGISTALMMTKPILAYPMVILVMFVASAPDKRGRELEEIIRRRPNENKPFPSVVSGIVFSLLAGFGVHYLQIEHFFFLDFGIKYGAVLTAFVFGCGLVIGGFLSDKAGEGLTGVASVVSSCVLTVISGSRTVILISAFLLGVALSSLRSISFRMVGFGHEGLAIGAFTSPAALAYFMTRSHYGMELPFDPKITVVIMSVLTLPLLIMSFVTGGKSEMKKDN